MRDPYPKANQPTEEPTRIRIRVKGVEATKILTDAISNAQVLPPCNGSNASNGTNGTMCINSTNATDVALMASRHQTDGVSSALAGWKLAGDFQKSKVAPTANETDAGTVQQKPTAPPLANVPKVGRWQPGAR